MPRKRVEKEEDIDKEPDEEFRDFKTTDAYSYEMEGEEMEDDILGDSDLNDYPEEFNEELDEAAREVAEEERKKKEAELAAKEDAKPKAKKKAVKKKAPTKKAVKKKAVKKKEIKKELVKEPEKEEVIEEPKVEAPEPKITEEDERKGGILSGRNVVIALCLILVAVWVYALLLPPIEAADSQQPVANVSENITEEPVKEVFEVGKIEVAPKAIKSESNKNVKIIKEKT